MWNVSRQRRDDHLHAIQFYFLLKPTVVKLNNKKLKHGFRQPPFYTVRVMGCAFSVHYLERTSILSSLQKYLLTIY